MKLIAFAAVALAIAPAPAFASSVYRQAQAGAAAYCAARAAGRSEAQAFQAFNHARVDVAGMGSFFNHRAVEEQGRFLARQMCPQYF